MNHKCTLIAAALALLGGVNGTTLAKPATPAPAPAAPATAPAKPAAPVATPAAKPAEAAKDAAVEKVVYAVIQTSLGDIVVELNGEKAPISTKNFVSYMDRGHYDGTIFHRVINGFMIQGGGFTADMKEKGADAPIKNEWQNGLKNKRGTIAMARKGDRRPNPETVNSATCQFYINVVDNNGLDQPQADGGAYAVFGQVISGMEVVDKIRAVKTGPKGGMGDVPLEAVTINKIRKATAEEVAKTKTPAAAPAPAATPAPAPAPAPAAGDKPGK
jgi:peptidyl-prolyl cis-trans isomerase A (cyclophilin A)